MTSWCSEVTFGTHKKKWFGTYALVYVLGVEVQVELPQVNYYRINAEYLLFLGHSQLLV